MKKLAKHVLISSFLLIFSVGFVTSCGGEESQISSSSNFSLEKSFAEVSLGKNVSVKVEGNIDNLHFAFEKGNIVDVSLTNDSIVISGKTEGVDRIKVYLDDPSNYQSILVIVKESDDSLDATLTIGEDTKTIYSKGESFFYNDAKVYLNTLNESREIVDTILLNPSEIYFSIGNGYQLEEVGETSVHVSYFGEANASTNYTITVLDDGLSDIREDLALLKETNRYEITYSGTIGSTLPLNGDLIFTPNYYYNDYSETYFAKDKNGVFKYDYVLDDYGVRSSISTSNGYFKLNGKNATNLSEVVSLYSGVSGIAAFDDTYLDSATKEGDMYVFTSPTLLDMFWSGTINLNGSAEYIALASQDDAITFKIVGDLTNGYKVTLIGSIRNIGTASEPLIENFLKNNSIVSSSVDETLLTYINPIKENNYKLNINDKTYVVTPNYVFNGDENGVGSGIIKLEDGIYSYSYNDSEVTIGSKSEISSIEESEYSLLNYGPFKEENYSSYYYSSYYGGYTLFDASIYADLWSYTNSNSANTPLVLTLGVEGGSLAISEYFTTSSGSLSRIAITASDIGTSSVSAIDNYLTSLD